MLEDSTSLSLPPLAYGIGNTHSSSDLRKSTANVLLNHNSTASFAWINEPSADCAGFFDAVSLFSATVWMFLLWIGVTGMVAHYARPVAEPPDAPPVQAKLIKVELTTDSYIPEESSPPPPSLTEPPPLLEPLKTPDLPPMTAVAAMDAPVAFALPVEGPVTIVEAAQASFSRQPAEERPVVAAVPTIQRLTFGTGEGRQPAPRYPLQASREGQEGVVRVRFSVGENGRVLEAEAVAPSPWPLLNREAVRTVLQRWRFRSGPVRLYEVAIRFELTK